MRNRTGIWIWILLISIPLFACKNTDEPARLLPRIKVVPHFSLTNQLNNRITRDDLAGSYWIANFIFTNCGGICPAMTFQMRKLQEDINPGIPVYFVSISVDPDRDTPEVLKAYAEKNNADHNRWYFLTGEKKEIFVLSREGFLLGVNPEGGSLTEPIMHSQKFVLVDREGYIRGYYDGFDETGTGLLIEDLNTLIGKEGGEQS